MYLTILSLLLMVIPCVVTDANPSDFERILYGKISAGSGTPGNVSITKDNIGSITSNYKAIYDANDTNDTNYNREINLRRSDVGETAKPEESNQIRMPLFGRDISLGDLYDATNDHIFKGMSLWNQATITKAKVKSQNPNSHSDFTSADTSFERVAALDISASIKLSFLGGLITVSGSAQYMRNSVESTKEVSGTMVFSATTYYESLDVNTPVEHNQYCLERKYKVTHVASTIQYGLDAYFDFRRKVNSSEAKEVIRGQLKASIASIPGFEASGQVDVNLEGTEKLDSKSVRSIYYGDFRLQSIPTTFEEASEAYKSLPGLLKQEQNKAGSKTEMLLTPIKFYCSQVNQLLYSIQNELTDNIFKMLGDIEKIKMRTNDLKITKPYLKFESISKHLNTFARALLDHTEKINEVLRGNLHKIKQGKGDTTILYKLIVDHNESPFEKTVAGGFLDNREREINIIQMILELSEDDKKRPLIQMVDYVVANDVRMLLMRMYVFKFEINILPARDDTLTFLKDKTVNKETWFNRQSALGTIRRGFEKFKDFALRNKENNRGFLIKLQNMKPDPVTLNIRKDGDVFTTDTFIYPEMPIIKDEVTTHSSFKVTVIKTDNKFVLSCIMAYWLVGSETQATEKEKEKVEKIFPISNLKNDLELVISGLPANRVYGYEIWYLTELGKSPVNSPQSYIKTRPTSSPENVAIDKMLSPYAATIKWDTPSVGENKIIEYEVQLKKDKTTKVSVLKRADLSKSVEFTGLDSATTYEFSVRAITTIPTFKIITDKEKEETTEEETTDEKKEETTEEETTDEKKEETEGEETTDEKKEETTKEKTEETIEGEHTSQWTYWTFTTIPEPPAIPSLDKVDTNYAVVSWAPVTKIATGSTAKGYELTWQKVDTLVDALIGDPLSKEYSASPAQIDNLEQGTTYVVKVKFLTTSANSPYSLEMRLKTKSTGTALDRLKGDLLQQTSKSVDEISKDLKGKVDAAKTEFNKNINQIRDNLRELNEAVTKVHRTSEKGGKKYPQYFPQYKAQYVAIGKQMHSSDKVQPQLMNGISSLEKCIIACLEKRKSDTSVNHVNFQFKLSQCYCAKQWANNRGNEYDYLHYKLD